MSRMLRNRENRGVRLIAYMNSKSPITEQYRLIRNNIHFSSVDKKIKTIVVSSAEPSEGKSTTAANLAIVLAEKGKKVILVDVDLRKPTVHYSFTVSNIDGLTSVLTKDITLDQAITKSHISNLDILTSGPIPPNPSELLDSRAMEMVIENLNSQYEYVVFDTPPILAVTDSQIIANKCDGVVMVVACGKTHKDRVLKAKELLEKAGSQMLGVVVNGVEEKMNGYYGHYR